MPAAAAVGTPVVARGRGLDTALRTQLAPGINTERPIGDPFTLQGPYPNGTVSIKVSQNQGGCAKNVTVRLYRDGILIQSSLRSMTSDSSAGTDQTYTLGIPPEPTVVAHRFWLTWLSPCGAGDLDSAYRVVSLPVLPPTQRLADRAWADTLRGPRLGPWWSQVTSAQQTLLVFQPGLGVRLSVATANSHVYGIRQMAPTGSFSVYGVLRENGGGNDVRSGVFVSVEGGKGHVCGSFLQDGGVVGAIGVTTTSASADWSGYDGFLVGSGLTQPVPMWTRIRWVAPSATLFFDVSPDGRTWTNFTSRAAMAQPDHLGACTFSNSGAIQLAESVNLTQFAVSVP